MALPIGVPNPMPLLPAVTYGRPPYARSLLPADHLARLDKRALVAETLDFVAAAHGTPIDGFHVESYHTGAGTSVMALYQNNPTDYCSFFIHNGELGQEGGTPEEYYSAYVSSSYNQSNIISFNIGLPTSGEFGLEYAKKALLSYKGSTKFHACPPAVLPVYAPQTHIVGVGKAPAGCYNLKLKKASCKTPAEKRQLAQNSTTIFPNFLVPVQSAQGDTQLGTQFIPKVVTGQSVDVSFNVGTSGSTCDVYFHLPGTGANPGNRVSSYTLTGAKKFSAQELAGDISSSTTYNNRPALIGNSIPFSLEEGQVTFIGSVACKQGAQQAFEITAVDDSSIEWFETAAEPLVGIVIVQH